MLLHWIWIDLDMEKYDKILRKFAIDYFVVCVSFNLFTFFLFQFFKCHKFFLNLELWVANAVEEAHLESWILFTRMQFIYKKRNTDSQAAQVGGTTNQKGTWTNKLKTV